MQEDFADRLVPFFVSILKKGKKLPDQYGSQAPAAHGREDLDLMKAEAVPGDRGGAAGADDIGGGRRGAAEFGDHQTPERIF